MNSEQKRELAQCRNEVKRSIEHAVNWVDKFFDTIENTSEPKPDCEFELDNYESRRHICTNFYINAHPFHNPLIGPLNPENFKTQQQAKSFATLHNIMLLLSHMAAKLNGDCNFTDTSPGRGINNIWVEDTIQYDRENKLFVAVTIKNTGSIEPLPDPLTPVFFRSASKKAVNILNSNPELLKRWGIDLSLL